MCLDGADRRGFICNGYLSCSSYANTLILTSKLRLKKIKKNDVDQKMVLTRLIYITKAS